MRREKGQFSQKSESLIWGRSHNNSTNRPRTAQMTLVRRFALDSTVLHSTSVFANYVRK